MHPDETLAEVMDVTVVAEDQKGPDKALLTAVSIAVEPCFHLIYDQHISEIREGIEIGILLCFF